MEPNTENTHPKSEPVLALTIYAMDEQTKIIEKLKEAISYVSSLTPKEFEGRKEQNGIIIKIVNLQ